MEDTPLSAIQVRPDGTLHVPPEAEPALSEVRGRQSNLATSGALIHAKVAQKAREEGHNVPAFEVDETDMSVVEMLKLLLPAPVPPVMEELDPDRDDETHRLEALHYPSRIIFYNSYLESYRRMVFL